MSAEYAASPDKQEDAKPEQKKKTREPKYTKLTQQELGACKPVLNPTWVILIFLAVAVVCIPLGVVCLYYGYQAQQVSFRYDQYCLTPETTGVKNMTSNDARQQYLWANAGNDAALTCTFNITLDQDFDPPVYLYYELNGFYQNHRRYVKSVSPTQLAQTKSIDTGVCDPQENFNGNGSETILPCGLIAWSLFNDTYQVARVSSNAYNATMTIPISDQGIALKSDVEHRYANVTPSWFNLFLNGSRGGGTFNNTLQENQRFIVWMRIAALPDFQKLWGIIYEPLYSGDTLQVTVVNQYNTYSFDGQKHFVLGTTTWLGGRNPFLGIAFIVTGGLSALFAAVFFALRMFRPREFGDVTKLSFYKPS